MSEDFPTDLTFEEDPARDDDPMSRLVLSLLVKRRDPSTKAAMKLLDDASAAIQYNRDLLQIALDQVGQGISVFDRELGQQFFSVGSEFPFASDPALWGTLDLVR